MRQTIVRLGLLVLFGSMSACGGGGGGGSSGGGGGGGSTPSEVVYVGNSNRTVITATNAAKLTSDVIGGSSAANFVIGAAVSSSATSPTQAHTGLTDLARRLNRDIRDTLAQTTTTNVGQRVPVATIQVDETDPCDIGSVRTVGTLNDNGTGTVSVTYNDCRIGGETLSGPATLRIDSFDLSSLLPTDFTISFPRLTLRGPGTDVGIGGSLRSQLSIGTNTETLTINLATLDNSTRAMTKAENLVIVNVYGSLLFPSSFTETVNGRLFDSVHGFVDISTPTPLLFTAVTDELPSGGRIQLTGAANASIRVRVVSNSLVLIEVDLNGDNGVDIVARLNWADLSTAVGSDLADSDADGIHNSWEVSRGLNPSNPADALLDNDNDGFSNLEEYRVGSDPNNASSRPLSSADLRLSISDSVDPAFTSTNFSYSLAVGNFSGSSARNVEIRGRLPAGVAFVSATGAGWNCDHVTGLVTCTRDALDGGIMSSVSLVVTAPATSGVIFYTATVSSDTADSNSANNSATEQTTVGHSLAALQAQINNAVVGETILVDPGMYVGTLDFHGKDVVLQSRNGPENTILSNRSERVVQIGPGATIRGFTIRGSIPSSVPTPPGEDVEGPGGGGIQISGAGTLISENVFEVNFPNPLVHGSAIGGNNASPIIERNIFRNNGGPDVPIGGVIAMEGDSSPLIQNNVFQTNLCRSIWLLVTSAGAPRVINNTFVGNLKGVRVYRGAPWGSHIYRNNIFVQNGTVLEANFGTDADNPVWENNLVFGNSANYVGTVDLTGSNGNISADPLFVNASNGDYHLQAGSPAIDAGSATNAPAIDFAGTSRPLGAGIDIGAFEAP